MWLNGYKVTFVKQDVIASEANLTWNRINYILIACTWINIFNSRAIYILTTFLLYFWTRRKIYYVVYSCLKYNYIKITQYYHKQTICCYVEKLFLTRNGEHYLA